MPPIRAICSALASLGALASAAFGQICTTGDSCLVVHPLPGCNSTACCTTVCTVDPTCCSGDWDSNCVLLANELCVGYCGATASGSCYAAHANPGCDSATCCTSVCAIDAFCCNTAWDVNCALFAGFACPGSGGTCGGPNTGSCFTVNTTGACSDVACCNAVCAVDPTCCSSNWDYLCVLAAEKLCVDGCIPTYDTNALEELEECDSRLNDPCYGTTGGSPQAVQPNRQVKGRVGRADNSASGPDVDVFTVAVGDTDGDGIAQIQLEFTSTPTAWAALVADAPCAPLSGAIFTLSSQFCVEANSPAVCVPAGTYRVFVSAGTFPQPGGSTIGCVGGNAYTFKVNVGQNCTTPCGQPGRSCFVARSTPGCTDGACCQSVCQVDPICCSDLWDELCVERAGTLCLSAPPANDLCAGAPLVEVGETMANTLRSGVELPQATKPCGGAQFSRDVFLRFKAPADGEVVVETCGSWFDTVVAVYGGSCASPTLVGCNDNATICAGANASRVTFIASCGDEYIVRVGPKSGAGGEVVVRIATSAAPCPQCPADRDGDGIVGAQDLAALLAGWGSAAGDITGDGTTNANDLAALLAGWGACP
ncbi:MAG: hypothetical protein ACKO0W_08670 [Planctomycetota bacterium]